MQNSEELRTIKIFLGSPSDVKPERAAASRVFQRLRSQIQGRAQIKTVVWEDKNYEANSSFQDQIPRPDSCDLAVFVLWGTLGSAEVHVDGKRYSSGTRFELSNALEAASSRRLPVMIWWKTAKQFVDVELQGIDELAELRNRKLEVNQFFSQELKSQTGLLGYNTFSTPEELEERLGSELFERIDAILKADFPEAEPRLATNDQSPFPGLKALDRDQQHLYFGRTKALYQAEKQFQSRVNSHSPFLAILAWSGAGKSSFVRAGLAPLIMASHSEFRSGRYALFEPSDSTVSLVQGLVAAIIADSAVPELKKTLGEVGDIARLLKESPRNFIAALRACLGGVDGNPNCKLLLVIDPLEEIFTREFKSDATSSDEEFLKEKNKGIEAFALALKVLCESELIGCIATMRNDFQARSSSIADLRELIQGEGHYYLSPLTATELGQCVKQPAIVAGLRFEATKERGSLADEMINEALKNTEPLPLLAFALEQVYELSRASQSKILTFDAFDKLEGVAGAINRRAESAFQEAVNRIKDPARIVAARDDLFGVLVGIDREGRRVRLYCGANDLTNPDAIIIREELDRARLILCDEDDRGEQVFTIAHETLIRGWQTLSTWIHEREGLLRFRYEIDEEATAWEASLRNADMLCLHGERLIQAQKFIRNSRGLAISKKLVAYVQANLSARNFKRRLLRLSILLGFLFLSLFSIGLWLQRVEAQSQSGVAQKHAKTSREFVNFLLGDLQKNLDLSNDRDNDLIDQIAKRVVAHYDSLDFSKDQKNSLPELAIHMQTVSATLATLSRHADALLVIEKSLNVLAACPDRDEKQLVRVLSDAGLYAFRAGEYARSEKHYLAALAVLEKLPVPDTLLRANTIGRLATLSKFKGHFQKGAKQLREVCEVFQNAGDSYQSALAEHADSLSDFLRNLGEFKEAEEWSKKAIQIALSNKDIGALQKYRGEYGTLLQKMGRLDEAHELLQLALSEKLAAFGDDKDTAAIRYRLARVLIEQKEFDRAKREINLAMKELDTPQSANHLRLAKCLEAKGMLLLAQENSDDFSETTQVFERCLAIRRNNYGDIPHPDVIDVVNLLSVVAEKSGKKEIAARYVREVETLKAKLARQQTD